MAAGSYSYVPETTYEEPVYTQSPSPVNPAPIPDASLSPWDAYVDIPDGTDTNISSVLEQVGEVAPVSYPGERVDYSSYSPEQLAGAEGSIQSLMGAGKSIASATSPYMSAIEGQYTGAGVTNAMYDDQYGKAPTLGGDQYENLRNLGTWAGGDYMYRADEEGQKYAAAQQAMRQAATGGGGDYAARVKQAQRAYTGALGVGSFGEATAAFGAYTSGVRDEATIDLNRAMLSGEQDKAHTAYSTYQDDLRRRQELQNELMQSSPEYQAMQEGINLQRESIDLQREELTAVQEQYQQMRDDFSKREQDLTQLLEGMGETERKNVEEQREQLKASQKEDLMRRGLTSTSALSAAMRGVDRTANQTLGELESKLRQQQLDYRAQFSGETLGAQEKMAQFAASAAQANFAAAQAVPTSMAELAQMLSEQRISKDSNRSGIAAAALSADASRYGAAMSASASKYASKLGYESDIYRSQSQERQGNQQMALDAWQTQQQSKLGYAQMKSGLEETKMQGEYGIKQQIAGRPQPLYKIRNVGQK